MILSALALVFAATYAGAGGSAAAPGLQRNVMFDQYSPLSASTEMLHRLLSPLTAQRVQAALTGRQIPHTQSIDLLREKFVLYVPAQEPPGGYALLVFVPPWEDARLPAQWFAAFERHGFIVVSAADSGNDANVLDRREPLALLAAHNIMQRYRVDASRIYVGGFSGGSRVALRLAVAYPDLFRGVLLNAGSDTIGNAQVPLPPADLFHQFQATRIVYLTGGRDAEHLDQDAKSRHSLQQWCVFDVTSESMPWTGHEVADASAFEHALAALTDAGKRDADKLAACNARIDQELAAQAREVEDLHARGSSAKARDALATLDERYGGLAAPRSLELAGKLAASK